MDDGIEDRLKSRPPLVVVGLLPVVGALAAIPAAIHQELAHASGVLTVVVAAVIEEICKPLGLIVILHRRGHWLTGPVQIVVFSCLAAAAFAAVENVMFIYGYHGEHLRSYVAFRFTVPMGVHLLASGVFGVGLAKSWLQMQRENRRFDVNLCFRWWAVAIVIHAAYNLLVVALEKAGVLKF